MSKLESESDLTFEHVYQLLKTVPHLEQFLHPRSAAGSHSTMDDHSKYKYVAKIVLPTLHHGGANLHAAPLYQDATCSRFTLTGAGKRLNILCADGDDAKEWVLAINSARAATCEMDERQSFEENLLQRLHSSLKHRDNVAQCLDATTELLASRFAKRDEESFHSICRTASCKESCARGQ